MTILEDLVESDFIFSYSKDSEPVLWTMTFNTCYEAFSFQKKRGMLLSHREILKLEKEENI